MARSLRSPLIAIPLGLAGFVALILLAALGLSLATLDRAGASCQGGSPAGPGPGSMPGIPQPLLTYFEGAGAYFQLGADGWAYLAALNYAESTFGTDNGPGTGVLSGSNPAGAAGPMQIGIGGNATDNWDTVVGEIPSNLPGGTQPPSVYNEADAVYAAAALLRSWGAPENWPAALVAWNDYQPEIEQVTSLVAQYTLTATTGAAPAAETSAAAVPSDAFAPCTPPGGPTTPGPVATIEPDGTATIPLDAPPQVQQAITAGNRIIDTGYSTERDPLMLSEVMSSYDCSGSTDFVLYQARLSSPQVDVGDGIAGDSTLLESYGAQGPGQWITVFGSTNHAFIEVAGLVLDTSHYAPTTPAGTGPRWQPASIIPAQLGDGNAWSERHPPGL